MVHPKEIIFRPGPAVLCWPGDALIDKGSPQFPPLLSTLPL